MASLSPDVVIVGGGIAGGTMATVLARNGLEVSILERETKMLVAYYACFRLGAPAKRSLPLNNKKRSSYELCNFASSQFWHF
jgi:choline dehydrogenase-like flavoprotein